jgi:serine/threonine protein phosphatase PrpC
MRNCPDCASPAAAGDRFCEECGTDLDPPVILIGGDQPVADAACAACGAVEVSADGYCEECGHRRPDPRRHVELEVGGTAGVSDRGLRHARNEDALGLAATDAVRIAIICDGVSTTQGAEDASLIGVRAATAVLARQIRTGAPAAAATRTAAAAAARAVAGLPRSGGEWPSCTFVSAVVDPEAVTAGWLGDCRVYWLGDEPALLTHDDSWAAQMVASGALSAAEAYADNRAHTIVRWLGADAADVEPSVVTFTPRGPGAVLVCSDGLWNYVPEPKDLARAVAGTTGPLDAARALVERALRDGGRDNITVALIPFPPGASDRKEA